MVRLSDKTLAERMLQAREQAGYTFLPSVLMTAKGCVVLVVYFGALLAFFAFTASGPVFGVIGGVVA